MIDVEFLARLEDHIEKKFGVKNRKGAEILERRCVIDTVLVERRKGAELWKTVTIEPIDAGMGMFKLICELEEELPAIGVRRTERTEELVAAREVEGDHRDSFTILSDEA